MKDRSKIFVIVSTENPLKGTDWQTYEATTYEVNPRAFGMLQIENFVQTEVSWRVKKAFSDIGESKFQEIISTIKKMSKDDRLEFLERIMNEFRSHN